MEVLVVVVEDCQGGVTANSPLCPALQNQDGGLALGPILPVQRDELACLRHTRLALSRLVLTSGREAKSI